MVKEIVFTTEAMEAARREVLKIECDDLGRPPKDIITIDLAPGPTSLSPRSTTLCPHCQRPFKTADGLRRHIAEKHSSLNETGEK